SLTIIGVVAAITLPSLTGNINERTWNTQRKALYARFSQAIALMPALNGYGTLTAGDSSTSAVDTAAETFVTAGLATVMKINNICDSDHLEDCGVPATINPLAGTSALDFPKDMETLNPRLVGKRATAVDAMDVLNTKAAAFETQNGETVVVYYNPHCVGSLNETAQGTGGIYIGPKLCANFIYDLNGTKGPNTVGKDIGFMSVLYPSDPIVVAPVPTRQLDSTYRRDEAVRACTSYDSDYRLPNRDELASLSANKNLISATGTAYWSASKRTATTGWISSFQEANIDSYGINSPWNIICVKR
ncbi:MAG: hypothetical protein NC390_08465, partial [Fusobacterium sp.]|nr:hypothetical protein [Fusobacterium sp.]